MRSPRSRRFAFRLAAVLAVLCGGWSATGLADLSEDQAKASLVYNLTKFVQWPSPPPDRVLNLCVYRDDPITSSLATLKDKTSKGLALRVQKAGNLEEAKACQLLYVGRGERANLRPLIQALQGQHILLVSDIPDSTADGVMVEIMLDNRRIGFRINKAAADDAGLRFSAQLISLAKSVLER